MSNKLRIAFGIVEMNLGDSNWRVIASDQAKMWLEIGNTLSSSLERFQLVMFESQFHSMSHGEGFAHRTLIEHATSAGADWLVVIRSDVWVISGDPSADAGFYLLRMISDADRAGATMVGAPVAAIPLESPVTEYPDDPELAVFVRDGQRLLQSQCLSRMFEAPAVGLGCVAINIQKLHSITVEAIDGIKFCEDVRAAGGRVLVDGRVTTGLQSQIGFVRSRRNES